jgi:hypothetical protein
VCWEWAAAGRGVALVSAGGGLPRGVVGELPLSPGCTSDLTVVVIGVGFQDHLRAVGAAADAGGWSSSLDEDGGAGVVSELADA